MDKKIERQILKDLDDLENLERKDVKVRITTMVDADVLDSLKADAKSKGIGYQTLLNMKLRELYKGKKTINEDDVQYARFQNFVEEFVQINKSFEKKIDEKIDQRIEQSLRKLKGNAS